MMNTMLIFSDYFYPGTGGAGPAKSICHFVNDTKNVLNCHVITRSWDLNYKKYTDNQIISFIKNNNNINCIFIKNYYIYFLFLLKFFKNKNKNNVIFLNSFFSTYFTFIPLLYNKVFMSKKKIFIAPRGELFIELINNRYLIKNLYILIFKFLRLDRDLIFVASNTFEQNAISQIFSSNKIILLSDGFDIKKYNAYKNKVKKINELNIIFLSRINFKKNLLFAIKLLSGINANIKFDFYGLIEDSIYYEACIKLCNNASGTVRFNYKGEISPDDVLKTIAKYDLMILPTLGENFGHVIAESLLSNTPVLISDKTPWLSDSNGVVTVIDLDLISKWNEQIFSFLRLDNDSYQRILKNIKPYLLDNFHQNDYDPFIRP